LCIFLELLADEIRAASAAGWTFIKSQKELAQRETQNLSLLANRRNNNNNRKSEKGPSSEKKFNKTKTIWQNERIIRSRQEIALEDGNQKS